MAILLVASIATIGAAPFSYEQQQQGASDRTGPRITSANIVDGEVKNQDLAPDAVTSDKIKNGEVKAEDLDPSIELGGGAGGFSLQVTERSNRVQVPIFSGLLSINVQCNSDEVVTGGGYSTLPLGQTQFTTYPEESRKQDNGWTVTWHSQPETSVQEEVEVHAECLKVVNTGTTG